MKRLFRLLVPLVLLVAAAAAQEAPTIIPRPASLVLRSGSFRFDAGTPIIVEAGASREMEIAALAAEAARTITGFAPPVRTAKRRGAEGHAVVLRRDAALARLGPEGYTMRVDTGEVLIAALNETGLWYGLQSFLQLLPPGGNGGTALLPAMTIEDRPRFTWRGMHLDVCRHFFPVSFVKRYIDLLAMYKMNTFHWHLTDDQGWRIEIKRYPELTEVGAWRSGTMVGPYAAQRYDSVRYGGYYTQEEIREVVAYAAARHVTIVPEIEMPGHALAALASHPGLACTPGPFEVAKGWGVFADVFCPKEETFAFLENVLTEVSALFPGKYVHIGGDECPKDRWKTCAHCQALMKRLRLKNENQLQSYFVRRIVRFLATKGKRAIGWDEILEGGLAPSAAVMSWRGTDGGLAAARKDHFVVMTPGSHCYLDHYQGNPDFEPLAIGGYTPVEKVYAYEPIPAGLPRAKSRFVLGAQGNIWTEYIASERHVEYMALPRMAALAEVVWTPAAKRAYPEFQARLLRHFALLDRLGVNYARSIFQISTAVDPLPSGGGVRLALSSPFDSTWIRYTTDGTEPGAASPRYAGPIPVTATETVRFCAVRDGALLGPVASLPFHISKSTGRKVTYKTRPHENYPGDGPSTLVNGISGNPVRHGLHWVGFWGPDLDATIDLGTRTSFSRVTIGFYDGEGSWIYLPKRVEILVSDDGTAFRSVRTLLAEEIRAQGAKVAIALAPQEARYVRVVALNAGTIPAGKQGSGNPAWLFADEIAVE